MSSKNPSPKGSSTNSAIVKQRENSSLPTTNTSLVKTSSKAKDKISSIFDNSCPFSPDLKRSLAHCEGMENFKEYLSDVMTYHGISSDDFKVIGESIKMKRQSDEVPNWWFNCIDFKETLEVYERLSSGKPFSTIIGSIKVIGDIHDSDADIPKEFLSFDCPEQSTGNIKVFSLYFNYAKRYVIVLNIKDFFQDIGLSNEGPFFDFIALIFSLLIVLRHLKIKNSELSSLCIYSMMTSLSCFNSSSFNIDEYLKDIFDNYQLRFESLILKSTESLNSPKKPAKNLNKCFAVCENDSGQNVVASTLYSNSLGNRDLIRTDNFSVFRPSPDSDKPVKAMPFGESKPIIHLKSLQNLKIFFDDDSFKYSTFFSFDASDNAFIHATTLKKSTIFIGIEASNFDQGNLIFVKKLTCYPVEKNFKLQKILATTQGEVYGLRLDPGLNVFKIEKERSVRHSEKNLDQIGNSFVMRVFSECKHRTGSFESVFEDFNSFEVCKKYMGDFKAQHDALVAEKLTINKFIKSLNSFIDLTKKADVDVIKNGVRYSGTPGDFSCHEAISNVCFNQMSAPTRTIEYFVNRQYYEMARLQLLVKNILIRQKLRCYLKIRESQQEESAFDKENFTAKNDQLEDIYRASRLRFSTLKSNVTSSSNVLFIDSVDISEEAGYLTVLSNGPSDCQTIKVYLQNPGQLIEIFPRNDQSKPSFEKGSYNLIAVSSQKIDKSAFCLLAIHSENVCFSKRATNPLFGIQSLVKPDIRNCMAKLDLKSTKDLSLSMVLSQQNVKQPIALSCQFFDANGRELAQINSNHVELQNHIKIIPSISIEQGSKLTLVIKRQDPCKAYDDSITEVYESRIDDFLIDQYLNQNLPNVSSTVKLENSPLASEQKKGKTSSKQSSNSSNQSESFVELPHFEIQLFSTSFEVLDKVLTVEKNVDSESVIKDLKRDFKDILSDTTLDFSKYFSPVDDLDRELFQLRSSNPLKDPKIPGEESQELWLQKMQRIISTS